MRTETVIDTIAFQCNFYSEVECIIAKDDIVERLDNYRVYIDGKECKLYTSDDIKFEYKYKTVVTIDKGSFSITTKKDKTEKKVWYLKIKLAGLKSYIYEKDKVSHNVLMQVVSYLNTKRIPMKITQFDLALNIFTKYSNVLALCTKRYATTAYWMANETQLFDTTRYIEKFKNEKHKVDAVSHACLYSKIAKENLDYQLVRFELSYQKKFFKNKGFDIGAMLNEFYRYHVMYIPNPKKKQEIMDEYDSLDVIRKKDVKDLKLERYRLHIDVNVLVDYMNKIYHVNDDIVEAFMI